ncbi:MAG: helix-turn-helix domain-containing protein [Raineya sp.]|jgi:transcriptional regulator with XRE-family HTH domain|nr:helix-turn-helix domain-containing protein [Raineya sp.]
MVINDEIVTVNHRISMIRQHYELSQKQFGEKLGIQSATISHIEKNIHRPNFDVVASILATYREINPYWLLLGEGKMFLDKDDPILIISNKKSSTNNEEVQKLQEDLEKEKKEKGILFELLGNLSKQ